MNIVILLQKNLRTTHQQKKEFGFQFNIIDILKYRHTALLTIIYAQELVTVDCCLTLMLQGLNTQPYTGESSTRKWPALLKMSRYRGINNYTLN